MELFFFFIFKKYINIHDNLFKMSSKTKKLYPDSGVELTPFTAIHYDNVMTIASLGLYIGFINKAIKAMNIQYEDTILDLGCGTGRNACIMAKYLGDSGKITGMDVSSIMEKQFNKRCANHQNSSFIRQRIKTENRRFKEKTAYTFSPTIYDPGVRGA